MAQFNITLTSTPQAVAGPGDAMFEGRDGPVSYWLSATAPDTSVLPFNIERGKREPMVVPNGVNLYLVGNGLVTVYSTTDPV